MINAIFTTGATSVTTEKLTQWDKGQTLRIKGINCLVTPQIQFTNRKHKEAINVSSVYDAETDSYTVDIPNVLAGEPHDIIAFIYETDTVTGQSVGIVRIPVLTRPKPANYIVEGNVSGQTLIELTDQMRAAIQDMQDQLDEIEATTDQKLEETVTHCENSTAAALEAAADFWRNQNGGEDLKLWVGTSAEYAALTTAQKADTFCYIIDEDDTAVALENPEKLTVQSDGKVTGITQKGLYLFCVTSNSNSSTADRFSILLSIEDLAVPCSFIYRDGASENQRGVTYLVYSSGSYAEAVGSNCKIISCRLLATY